MILLFYMVAVPIDLYNHANAEYESGNYFDAIELYNRAEQDIENANIHYNLGNAYFKTGQTGMAIKHFRQAHFLAPRDLDIRYNLLYARSFRVDKIGISVNPIIALINRIFSFLSLYEAQILSGLIVLLTAILISCFIIFRHRLFIYISAGFTIIALLCFISWASWSSEVARHPAVIIVPEATALSGPAEEYREIVKVHDGTEAYIRDERNEYYLIQLPGGIGGWVKKNTVEEIF